MLELMNGRSVREDNMEEEQICFFCDTRDYCGHCDALDWCAFTDT